MRCAVEHDTARHYSEMEEDDAVLAAKAAEEARGDAYTHAETLCALLDNATDTLSEPGDVDRLATVLKGLVERAKVIIAEASGSYLTAPQQQGAMRFEEGAPLFQHVVRLRGLTAGLDRQELERWCLEHIGDKTKFVMLAFFEGPETRVEFHFAHKGDMALFLLRWQGEEPPHRNHF